jgi:hypothetical protein
MKIRHPLAFIALSLAAASPAFASLIGATVTGTLNFGGFATNYFDPANGNVPVGYLNSSPGNNTVVVSDSAVEFGFAGFGANMRVQFTDTQLIISSVHLLSGAFSPTMTFSSSAFSSLNLVTQTYTPGVTSSLVGNLITINFAGGFVTQGSTYNAIFAVGSAGVPDGGSTCLLFVGALLAGVAATRRLTRVR